MLRALHTAALGMAAQQTGVDNIANKSYWGSALGGYLVQGMPRTFKASATVEF